MNIAVQLEYLFRILLAAVCGIFIGYERKKRGKGAGIRTHLVVALASSLMMIISKYGFADMTIGENGVRGADGARIAAQIVSGVGFLGAGMIYFNKNSVRGLTTAAGIWATAGCGMALGAGMYFIGISASAAIVLAQIIFHRNIRWLHLENEEQLVIVIENSDGAKQNVINKLNELGIHIDGMEYRILSDGDAELTLDVLMPQSVDFEHILKLTCGDSLIKRISI